MKYSTLLIAVLGVLALASGCERKKTSSRKPSEKSGNESTSHQVDGVSAQSDEPTASNSIQIENRLANKETNSDSVNPSTPDLTILAPVDKEATKQATNLGQVRQELSDLVQQAIETKKELLSARFKASAKNDTGNAVPGS